MDLNRVLGALLGGAATPPRRRRRTSAATLLGGRSTEARIGRLLAGVAGAAIGAMMKGSNTATPAPAPGPSREPRREAPAPTQPQANPWRLPEAAPAPVATAPAAEDAEDLLMIRAMIAAAHADGSFDAAERRAIAAQLDAAGLDAEERDFVLADFDTPMRIQALAQAANDPMLKARLYAAAVAGAGQITPPERSWLDDLAKALKLDRAAAAAIEARLAG